MSHHNRLGSNMQEYKGMFFNEEKGKVYYEGGAHFSSKELIQRLKALTKRLSPDRLTKPDVHQKTKSFAIEKISLKAINKNELNNPKRESGSLEHKKVNTSKANNILMLKTITNCKEEGTSSKQTIDTEITKIKSVNQLKPKVKLNPINFNKAQQKRFPIIKQANERFTSRNNNVKLLLPKNNTLVNPYLSIDSIGQQLTERKITKITCKTKKIKLG